MTTSLMEFPSATPSLFVWYLPMHKILLGLGDVQTRGWLETLSGAQLRQEEEQSHNNNQWASPLAFMTHQKAMEEESNQAEGTKLKNGHL